MSQLLPPVFRHQGVNNAQLCTPYFKSNTPMAAHTGIYLLLVKLVTGHEKDNFVSLWANKMKMHHQHLEHLPSVILLLVILANTLNGLCIHELFP